MWTCKKMAAYEFESIDDQESLVISDPSLSLASTPIHSPPSSVKSELGHPKTSELRP